MNYTSIIFQTGFQQLPPKQLMKKQKNKEALFNSDSDKDSDQDEIGRPAARKDYITLKKNKPRPLLANEQSEKSVQLFRNQELFKYLQSLAKEQEKNPRKKPQKGLKDPKQQVIDKVFFNLKNGWNVCLTAGMDKTEILDDVVQRLQGYEQNVFVIRGFAQPLNEKKIYNAFGGHLITCKFTDTINSVHIKDQLIQYENILKETSEDTLIYVVFYDLSNYGFLSSQIQQRLSNLLSLPRLRVIASIQSCKVVLTWSLNTLKAYNFVFVSANSTNIPITKLLRFMPLPNEKSQKTELQISQIWKSLNRNQRQIAAILAQNQLQNLNSTSSDQNYLSFQQLLDECIDKIILSDDHQLRQNLIELIDHRVIIEEIDKNKNKKVFIMKLDRRILENIVSGKYDKYDMGDEQK